ACAPCYLKSHSQGEYVFDRSWAEAYERAGGRYYPKLQIAVPFTPVPGRRLLVRPGPGAEANEAMLAEAAVQLVERNNQSGLHIIAGDCLYGRYWGAVEHHPCLHFELCYYQAIEFAIAHGIARVEAGAQGEHKLARGYLPAKTYSVHYIADPALRRAIADYLE